MDALSIKHTDAPLVSNPADEYINYVIQNAAAKSVMLEEIQAETMKDKILQNVAMSVQSGIVSS